MQANPNKITSYYVDLAPGSSLDLGNQNGYPRIAATAPGRSVVVAQVCLAYHLFTPQCQGCAPSILFIRSGCVFRGTGRSAWELSHADVPSVR